MQASRHGIEPISFCESMRGQQRAEQPFQNEPVTRQRTTQMLETGLWCNNRWVAFRLETLSAIDLLYQKDSWHALEGGASSKQTSDPAGLV